MKIPENEYSFDSFLSYLADHEMRVFGGGERKQWLKVYLVYAQTDWKELFKGFPQKKLGELTKIAMQAKSVSKPVDFYVHEWSPGILVFFTSSRKKEYEKTLRKFIWSNRGITEMWIPRTLFTEVRNFLLEKYSGIIYSFISRRYRSSRVEARTRPDVDRRLSYTGDDGTRVLKEVLEQYGVTPNSISFKIDNDKIQITNKGMLLFRSVNSNTLSILKELLRILTERQRKVREVSNTLRREIKTIQLGKHEIRTSIVVPGIIQLQGRTLDRVIVEHFFRQENQEFSQELDTQEDTESYEFSFIDTSIKEGSFSFTATVVDDLKGTMFGLSGSSDRMILVPMHRTTFESFIRFYKLVMENLDEEAKFDVIAPKTA
ncbi:MAG: hypothetical protein ACHQ03_04650 [Candidatus Bathyarchaeia archaeon]